MSKRSNRQIIPPGCVVLDSEGLSRHLKKSPEFKVHLANAVNEGREFAISFLTLGEGIDRAKVSIDRINYIRSTIHVVDGIEEDGILMGKLMDDSGKHGQKHTIDAAMCAMAIRIRAKRIITSDPTDLGPMLNGHGIEVEPI